MKKKKDDKDEDEDEERKRVIEYLSKEVDGWEDDDKVRVWFKGFSGQSSDYEWQRLYIFWKQLIINVCRHLGTFIIRPHQLKYVWFRRGPFCSPLCLDTVLVHMCNSGDLFPMDLEEDVTAPPQFSLLLRKLLRFFNPQNHLTTTTLHHNHSLIVSSLLKERCDEVVKLLSESHWTPSCVISLNKFRDICGGALDHESSAVLTRLSHSGRAKYLSIQTTKDLIQGVKIAISPGADCAITSLDYDVLHLLWTVERLEKKLHVIDSRWNKFKRLALASLKSGDRTVALRHAKELKLASQGREKCAALLNQVEDVLRVIADAESSKKVSEAIIIGARAIKENRISAEEVQLALEDLDESIASQKQVDKLMESTPSDDEEDIEDELRQLELEMNMEPLQVPVAKADADDSSAEVVKDALDISDSLSSALSGLKLRDDAATEASSSSCSNVSKRGEIEAA